jgi:citrate synthase
MGQLITAQSVADRLGIELRTVYAYVSRGALTKVEHDARRRSLYDTDEVELLARHGRPRAATRSRAGLEVVIGSSISTISNDSIQYRGYELADLLSARLPFEQVAELLWTGHLGTFDRWRCDPAVQKAATRAVRSLGSNAQALDRMIVAIAAARPAWSKRPLADTGQVPRELVLCLTSAIGAGSNRIEPEGLAREVCRRLSPLAVTPARVAAVNAALVALADHELATSTLAVRVAASARADLASCVLAGLAALSGSLHGGAANRVHEFLAAPPDAHAAALDDLQRTVGALPVHRRRDPRFAVLWEFAQRSASAARRATIEHFRQRLDARGISPNVDVALGALCFGTAMPVGSAPALFAIARCVGWIAHADEEQDERPLRFRGRAVPRTAPAGAE